MRPPERYDEIVRLVHRKGEVSVDGLAEQFGVSRETIRRDLSNLDAMDRVKKFHGGARIRSNALQEPSVEGHFALRLTENLTEKRKIAYAASRLLSPGDALFVDTGTTTLMLAEALVDLPSLVVITNSCKIAATVAANVDHKVFLIGGYYGSDAGQSLGHLAVEQIKKFRAKHAFLTAGAVDDTSIMDFDAQETEVARAMIERAEKITILADSTKMGKRGIFEVAQWELIDCLVTDQLPPDSLVEVAKSNNVEIVIP